MNAAEWYIIGLRIRGIECIVTIWHYTVIVDQTYSDCSTAWIQGIFITGTYIAS